MKEAVRQHVTRGWISATVIALACFIVALALLSWFWPAERSAAPWPWTLSVYWLAYAAVWALLSALAWRLWYGPDPRGSRTHPEAWGSAAAGIVLVALAARGVTVFATTPVLSDDIARYVDDGKTLAQGENPYARSPMQKHGDEAVGPAGPINHPELVTIYQPVSQYVFAAAWRVHVAAKGVFGWFDARITYRLGFVLCEVALIALLLWQLKREDRSPWWAALYAWHPLAVTEVAASGHQDVIGIALLVGALMCAAPMRGDLRSPAKRVVVSGALLALAVAVKPIVLPLALPMVWRLRWRGVWFVLAMGVVLTAAYLPFVFMEGGIARMVETGRTFVDKWAFNGSLHALAQSLTGDKAWADGLMALLLGVVLLVVTFVRVDVWRAAGVYLLAAVLVSSTAHPWYVLWPLALVAVRFEPVVWVLGLMVVVSYEAWLHPVELKPAAWVVWSAYVPVYAVAVLVGMLWWTRRGRVVHGD